MRIIYSFFFLFLRLLLFFMVCSFFRGVSFFSLVVTACIINHFDSDINQSLYLTWCESCARIVLYLNSYWEGKIERTYYSIYKIFKLNLK